MRSTARDTARACSHAMADAPGSDLEYGLMTLEERERTRQYVRRLDERYRRLGALIHVSWENLQGLPEEKRARLRPRAELAAGTGDGLVDGAVGPALTRGLLKPVRRLRRGIHDDPHHDP